MYYVSEEHPYRIYTTAAAEPDVTYVRLEDPGIRAARISHMSARVTFGWWCETEALALQRIAEIVNALEILPLDVIFEIHPNAPYSASTMEKATALRKQRLQCNIECGLHDLNETYKDRRKIRADIAHAARKLRELGTIVEVDIRDDDEKMAGEIAKLRARLDVYERGPLAQIIRFLYQLHVDGILSELGVITDDDDDMNAAFGAWASAGYPGALGPQPDTGAKLATGGSPDA